jgi:hypothetical protein
VTIQEYRQHESQGHDYFSCTGEVYGTLEVSWDYASINGIHMHFWVPTYLRPDEALEAVSEAVAHAKRERDVVRWTWGFTPK